jgi:hypothetical protein
MENNQTPDNRDDRQSTGTSTVKGGQESRQEPIPAPKPSQAEGDRDTVEQDLREKEGERDA